MLINCKMYERGVKVHAKNRHFNLVLLWPSKHGESWFVIVSHSQAVRPDKHKLTRLGQAYALVDVRSKSLTNYNFQIGFGPIFLPTGRPIMPETKKNPSCNLPASQQKRPIRPIESPYKYHSSKVVLAFIPNFKHRDFQSSSR